MAILNDESREITFKLVYTGTPMAGKTSNLSWIHQRLDNSARSDLITLATMSDRTLFFDFLAVESVLINGYRSRFQLYTVPGQANYNATRQIVLRGADGLVFVADSDPRRAADNLAAWHALHQHLAANRTHPGSLPIVLQYNKRDLPNALPREVMDQSFRSSAQDLTVCEASATSGTGVFNTLNSLARLVVSRFHSLHSRVPAAL
jgi:signal recognition particle receptor subunit beta